MRGLGARVRCKGKVILALLRKELNNDALFYSTARAESKY